MAGWDRVLKFLLRLRQLEADIVNLFLCLLNCGPITPGIPQLFEALEFP